MAVLQILNLVLSQEGTKSDEDLKMDELLWYQHDGFVGGCCFTQRIQGQTQSEKKRLQHPL